MMYQPKSQIEKERERQRERERERGMRKVKIYTEKDKNDEAFQQTQTLLSKLFGENSPVSIRVKRGQGQAQNQTERG